MAGATFTSEVEQASTTTKNSKSLLVYAQTEEAYLTALSNGTITQSAVVFVKDTKSIWTHGTEFPGPYTEAEISTLLASKQDTLTAGENITIDGGTISAKGTTYAEATDTTAGLMSAADKQLVDLLGTHSYIHFSVGTPTSSDTTYTDVNNKGTYTFKAGDLWVKYIFSQYESDWGMWLCLANDGTTATWQQIDGQDDQIGSDRLFMRQPYQLDSAPTTSTEPKTYTFGDLTFTPTVQIGYTDTNGVCTCYIYCGSDNSGNHIWRELGSTSTVGSGTLTIADQDGDAIGTFNANATSDNTIKLPIAAKEKVTVTVTTSDGSSVAGQVVTINGTDYTLDSTGVVTAKVPLNTTYSISVDSKSGYTAPSTQTFTASQDSRAVSMTYQVLLGIYILDTDGNAITAANWNTSNNSKAVGILVSTSACTFVMALKDAYSSSCTWGGYGTTVSGIVTTTDSSTAKVDYAGAANTAKIIAQLGASSALAANYCQTFTFPNGKTGYMGAAGEWQAVLDNKSAIDTALSKCGGTALKSYYWTSTQYDSSHAWDVDFSSSNLYDRNKDYTDYVRSFCALPL